MFLIFSFLKKLEKVMIFPSKNLAKFFDRLYLESGNYRLVIFLIVPDLNDPDLKPKAHVILFNQKYIETVLS